MSALTAFNAAFNVASYALLQPKRRSHHAPTYAKHYPPIKSSSTSCSSSSPSLLQVRSTSQRKDASTKTCNLPPEPCRISSILTSWDEDDHYENKEKLPSTRKNETKDASIFLRFIFNVTSKNFFLKRSSSHMPSKNVILHLAL